MNKSHYYHISTQQRHKTFVLCMHYLNGDFIYIIILKKTLLKIIEAIVEFI